MSSEGPPARDAAPLVVVDQVRRCFGTLTALDGVSLSIGRGECYALLGPNGAGKTTLTKAVAGVMPIDSGRIQVFGLDPRREPARVRAGLGWVLQDDALDEDLDVASNLDVHAGFLGLRRAERGERRDALLARMGLAGREGARIHELSGGMRRRLTIARALLGRPRLLILDEPTTGLDPQVRHAIWDVLRELRERDGLTIWLTTHYMEEAEQLADRVGVLNAGRRIAEGPPRELVREHLPAAVLDVRVRGRETVVAALGEATRLVRHGDQVSAFHDDPAVLHRLAADHELSDALVRRTSLEDLFLELTGRSLDG